MNAPSNLTFWRILKEACSEYGVTLKPLQDGWFVELEKNGITKWVIGHQLGLNNEISVKITRDKVLTYDILHRANIPAIPHYLVKSSVDDKPKLRANSPIAKDACYLLKPLCGSQGKGISLHQNIHTAMAAAEWSVMPELAISPLLHIVSESRIIVLDDEIMLSYCKVQPQMVNEVPMFKLAYGSSVAEGTPDIEMTDLAVNAAKACRARFVAVDIAVLEDGRKIIVELNSAFSIDRYAKISNKSYRQVVQVYKRALTKLFD